jgi:hypothetical protein
MEFELQIFEISKKNSIFHPNKKVAYELSMDFCISNILFCIAFGISVLSLKV